MRRSTLSTVGLALAAATLALVHDDVAAAGDKPASHPAAAASRAGAKAPGRTEAATESSSARWTLSERDKTLKGALERWSHAAGWRLFWELGVDYRIEATASMEGTFEEAVGEVMKTMAQAEVPPRAIFYRGNGVLRVVARGME